MEPFFFCIRLMWYIILYDPLVPKLHNTHTYMAKL